MRVLIIGTGPMAAAYCKVLASLEIPFDVIGRSEASCELFFRQNGWPALPGGILRAKDFILSGQFSHTIIAVSVDQLSVVLKEVLLMGIERVLIEKPAAISVRGLEDILSWNLPLDNVIVAYNRRFYASVLEAENLIKEDGGLKNVHFEFTEWVHKIKTEGRSQALLANWFLANSSHVVDLAFFLAGNPKEWQAYSGSGQLPWHEKVRFAGSGITDKEVLFTYMSNWESAGRWAVELLTDKRRIYLRPLEGIDVQLKGSVQLTPHEFDSTIDLQFKPGLYLQVKAFLAGDTGRMINLPGQIAKAKTVYAKMLA